MKNHFLKICGVVALTVAVSLITIKLNTSASQVESGAFFKPSVYDRVLKSGTIRAGYLVYPPTSIKDPNTGELSGIFVEALNKAAENMGLKVEWNAEVGWSDMIEGLNSDKYDIVGSAVWSNSTRGKSAEFIVPLYYSAINAYVRVDDQRFKPDGYRIANNNKFKVVSVDGETSQLLATKLFPEAQKLSLSQAVGSAVEMLNVVNGKADMAFIEPAAANEFMKNNPGKIRNITVKKPLAVYGNSMMVKKGEQELKSMLDTAMNELLGNGYIDGLIDKYEKLYSKGFYRVSTPYVVPRSER